MAATVKVLSLADISSKVAGSLMSNHATRCKFLMSTKVTDKNETETDVGSQEQNLQKEPIVHKTKSTVVREEKDKLASQVHEHDKELNATNVTDKNKMEARILEQNLQKEPAAQKARSALVTEEKDKLASQVQKLEEELKAVKDRYAQSLAEVENLKVRMMKQVEDARLFGIQGFCKDLAEVSDILSTAINSVPKEELQNCNPHLVRLFEGLDKTDSQLIQVFSKHGVESVLPQQGDKFDPNCHEALFQVPIKSTETQVADTVAHVQKVGYKLHNRTLRPALVGVFKAS